MTASKRPYVVRLVDGLLPTLLTDHPAVLLVGPRASGKTTTARRYAKTVLRLDRPAEARAVQIDPDAAVADGPYPLLIDEWHLVPEVLGAIKRAVDDDPQPGRFLLTGSSQADLTVSGWAATGRVIRLHMFGLTERELSADPLRPSLVERWATGDPQHPPSPTEPIDIRGYVDRALRGGFPDAVFAASDRARERWGSSYLDQLVSRDLTLTGAVRNPAGLWRYLQAVAMSTAGAPQHKTLYDAAGIDRSTAVSYDALLEQLMITERLPAWSSNRLNRLGRLPKRHLVEPALIGPLLGVDARTVLRDGDLLGRTIDSFVTAQLRALVAASDLGIRLFHLRDANGVHEVDLILEFPDGRVIGVEIKADAAPDLHATRHLEWLKAAMGERFVAGVVFHSGPRVIPYAPDLVGLPICALW